jgi:hypothetical protein
MVAVAVGCGFHDRRLVRIVGRGHAGKREAGRSAAAAGGIDGRFGGVAGGHLWRERVMQRKVK